jgi:hypothetical protein
MRVLDVAWLVFGHEPYAFRLSTSYAGPTFCHIIGCSPLRGGHPSPVVETPWSFVLPRDRGLRTMTFGSELPRSDLEPVLNGLALEAVDHAAVLGDLSEGADTAIDLSMWAFREITLRGRSIPTVHDVLVDFLRSKYESRGVDVSEFVSRELDAVARELRGERVEYAAPVLAGYVAPWATAAAPTYRQVLRAVYDQYGPPQMVVNASTEWRGPTPSVSGNEGDAFG